MEWHWDPYQLNIPRRSNPDSADVPAPRDGSLFDPVSLLARRWFKSNLVIMDHAVLLSLVVTLVIKCYLANLIVSHGQLTWVPSETSETKLYWGVTTL